MIEDALFEQPFLLELPAGATGTPVDCVSSQPLLEVPVATGGRATGILLSGEGFDFFAETSHTFST